MPPNHFSVVANTLPLKETFRIRGRRSGPLDRAVDGGRRFARDEVQIVACLCAAVEFYRLVLFDGEILSFKDVVLAFAHDVHDRAARRNIRRPRIHIVVRPLAGQRIRRRRGKGRNYQIGRASCRERV